MPRGLPPAVTLFMRPPLVPVPRLPEGCNLCGHSRRRSLSCSPRRYSTGCNNRYPQPQGTCKPDGRISSCLSCLPYEQFPRQPANLYAPWIGLPGCHEAPPGCNNRYPQPQGTCKPDGRISSCLSCLPYEQFPRQPANLYAPWIGLPGCHEAPPGGMLPRFPGVSRHAFSVLASPPRLS